MLSTESRRGRRILARLDRGTDLFDGVRTLCQKHQIHCAEVRGIGTLELAELTAFDQGSRRWKPARIVGGGGLELLQLQGNIAEERGAVVIQAQVTLMRDRDAGVEVLGGHLLRAVVHSVELVIETFDDVLLRRQLDVSTGLSRWEEALSEVDLAATTPAALPASAPAATPAALPASAPAATPTARSVSAPAASAPPSTPAARPVSASAASAPPSTPAVRPNLPAEATPNPRAAAESGGAAAKVTAPPANPLGNPSANPSPSKGPSATPFDRPAPTATPTPTWADVAAASQGGRPARRLTEPEPHDEEVFLNAGDVILHPRFQRCVVHRVEGGGEFVQVMLRNGRVVRLSLEVLRLTPQGVENGQRIFAATVL